MLSDGLGGLRAGNLVVKLDLKHVTRILEPGEGSSVILEQAAPEEGESL